MKGNYSVTPSFQPLNIHRPQLLLIHPLVVYDHRRLYFNSHSIFWQSKAIINCTHSKQHGVLLVLCQDGRLYIYTESLDLLSKVKWESKYTVCFRFIEEISAFLMIGVGEIELCRVSIVCNVRQTKFLSSMKCEIHQSRNLRVEEATKLKWHKGYDVVVAENLLYAWSLQDVNFYRLNNLELIVKMENITKKQTPLTQVFYNSYYKYVVVGYINGQIKIWKLPDRQTQKRQLIHTFLFHTKSIVNIIKAQDPRHFVSHSSDQRIALWNLDTFELLYSYDFLSEYENIWLNDYRFFYAQQGEMLGKCSFGCRLEFMCNINSSVLYFDKHFSRAALRFQDGNALESIQITLNSNLGLKIDSKDLLERDVNKANVQYFYPPLKSKSILQIIQCPFETNRFYFLVESGQIYRTRIQANSGKIQSVYSIDKIIDEQSHQLNQVASLIKFLKVVPPKFDSQIIGRIYTNQLKTRSQPQEQLFEKKQLLAIGCNKGAIIFLERRSFEKIHTRITYHREAIVSLESIYCEETGETFLLSLCAEMLFKVIRFEQDKSVCLQTISFLHSVQSFRTSTQLMFCILPKGLFQIFHMSPSSSQLCCIQYSDSTDHQDTILSLDFDQSRRLIVTAAIDQKIKLWTFTRILLYQITLNEGMDKVIMANEIDLLVIHDRRVSLLRRSYFQVTREEVVGLEEEFRRNNTEEVELASYLEKARMKRKSENIESPSKSILRSPVLKSSPKMQKRRVEIEGEEGKQKEKEKEKEKQAKVMKRSRRSAPHHREKISEQARLKKEFLEDQREDLKIIDKHVSELNEIRKSNHTHLPKIGEKQSLFDEFMKAKLLNKKILTRRDITLNRIIMKNIIREYIGADIVQGLNGVKVDM